MENFLLTVLWLLFAICFLIIGGLVVDVFFIKHDHVCLRLDEWTCIKTVNVERTVMRPIGKVLVPFTEETMECVDYKRK